MKNNYEDEECCHAFDTIFYQIRVLQNSESNLKYQNTNALKKCKEEIENLLSLVASNTESEGRKNTAKVS